MPPLGGYDLSYSELMGAQLNQQAAGFNSSGRYAGFGPFEQLHSVVFYPGIFSTYSAPSPTDKGSTVVLDHFVAYVEGATTLIHYYGDRS